MTSTRKFTIYLREKWQGLLAKFLRKKELSFQDFYRWFNVSKTSEEDKNKYIPVMIDRLINKGIIKKDPNNGLFSLGKDGLDRVVEGVNTGHLRDGTPYYSERELLSIRGYYKYIYKKQSFFQDLDFLINEYWDKMAYWERLGNEYGQIVYYIRAEYYYNEVLLSQLDTHDYSKTNEKLLDKRNIRDLKRYRELKNHFEKCTYNRCRKCGGNIVNIIKIYIERVKYELRTKGKYLKLIQEIKHLPYIDSKKAEVISSQEYKGKVDSIIDLKDNDPPSKKSIILMHLDFELKMEIINLVSLSRQIFKDYGPPKNREKSPRLESIMESYRKDFNEFLKILYPNPILDNVNSRIIEEFSVDKKVYQKYNKAIRNIGREGEKRISEGLIKDFPESKVEWKNEDGESGHPYDILLEMKDGEKKYIEVKTTHTDQRSFEMSENEFQFAKKNNECYKIYLIVNFGKGPDTYVEEIDDFNEYQKKGTLEVISRRFRLT